eukprot:9386599-Pyramimonas_sp.AAC.2
MSLAVYTRNAILYNICVDTWTGLWGVEGTLAVIGTGGPGEAGTRKAALAAALVRRLTHSPPAPAPLAPRTSAELAGQSSLFGAPPRKTSAVLANQSSLFGGAPARGPAASTSASVATVSSLFGNVAVTKSDVDKAEVQAVAYVRADEKCDPKALALDLVCQLASKLPALRDKVVRGVRRMPNSGKHFDAHQLVRVPKSATPNGDVPALRIKQLKTNI